MTYLFLAQLPPVRAGSIEMWLISATCVLVMVERVISFWKNHLREQPPPNQTYVTLDGCHDTHARSAQERLELRKDIDCMWQDQSHIQEALSAQVTSARNEFNDAIRRVHERIDQIPDRIIATLRNTNVIK